MILDALQGKTFGHLGTAKKPIPANPTGAIYKKWLALKAENVLIGLPLGGELALDDGTVAQAFSSGGILRWTGGDNVELV